MIVLFTASFAQAQMFNIKPLNRLSAGVSYVDESYAASMTFESRLTQIVYLNIGGFRSFSEVELLGTASRSIEIKAWYMGCSRISNASSLSKRRKCNQLGFFYSRWFWLFFNDVADKPYAFNMEPGGVLGADLLILWRRIGMRLSGKSVFQKAYVTKESQSLMLISSGIRRFYYQF